MLSEEELAVNKARLIVPGANGAARARTLAKYSWLSDEGLLDFWDEGSKARGVRVAKDSKLLAVTFSPTGGRIDAVAQGSGQQRYDTVVQHNETTGAVTSWCSCPVGMYCKHAFAVMVLAASHRVANENTPGAAGAWRSDLQRTMLGLHAAGTQSVAHRNEYALVVEQNHDGQWAIRVLKKLQSGAWSKSFAWDKVDAEHRRDPSGGSVLAAIHRFHRLHTTFATNGWWAFGEVLLSDLVPEQVAALWRMIEGGVPVLTSRSPGSPPCSLSDASASLAVQLHGEVDGSLTLRSGVQLSAAGSDDETRFVPSAEGAVICGDTPEMVIVVTPDGGGVACKLAHAVEAGESAAWRSMNGTVVPKPSVESFVSEYLPAIARRFTVVSDYDGIEPPTVEPPRLVVTVDHRSDEVGVSGGVSAHFEYGQGENAKVIPAVSVSKPQGTSAPQELLEVMSRDLAREQELLGHLEALPVSPLEGEVVDVQGGTYRDLVLQFALHSHELEGVEWVETGVAPQFEEVGDDLIIDVSVDADTGEDWFNLEFVVKVAGVAVPAGDFITAIVQGKAELTLGTGQWVDLTRPELEHLKRLIAEARRYVPEASEKLTVSRYHASWWDELIELGPIAVQAKTWFDNLAAHLDDDAVQPEVPGTVKAELRHYQHEGFTWLATLWRMGLGGILADDMGLGKTLQVLTTIAWAQEELPPGDGPTLVVAPTSVVHNWQREAQRFTPSLRVNVVGSTEKKTRGVVDEACQGADIVVTSYQRLRLDEDAYAQRPWNAVIFDEAHMVKNPSTQTYRAAASIKSERKILLTGTPVENSLMDLWSLLRLCSPGLLEKREVFRQHYVKQIDRGEARDRLALLHKRIAPFVVRRTKEIVASELPEKSIHVTMVDLVPAHQKIYDRALARERQNILGLLRDDMGKKRIDVLAGLTRLRRLCLDVGITREKYSGKPPVSAKREVLMNHLNDLVASGHKALVFSQFTDYLDAIEESLRKEDISFSRLDGSTADREAAVASFKEPGTSVFLISLKAGGVGLTLTEADYVFIMDPWWNPAAENQAIDRAHRIGQDKPVTVYRLIAAGTIEEKVYALQQRKQELFDAVMGDSALDAAPLTNSDIAELLSQSVDG